jgi:hypothetical protein
MGQIAMSRVELGDGIEAMGKLEGCVHLLCSDLPSGQTRAAFDKKPDLAAFWSSAWRALVPDGVAVLFASHLEFASELVSSARSTFRYDLVWHKSLATGFLNARRRPLRAHEHLLVFSRSADHPYCTQMVPRTSPVHGNAGRRASGENYGPSRGGKSRAGAMTGFPTSVLSFASVGTTSKERRHPQQKPRPLLVRIILTYSRPGALVIDPFAGSGVCGEAAEETGRRFLGWDTDPRWGASSMRETWGDYGLTSLERR